jgi:PAS domain S-box-containing protein
MKTTYSPLTKKSHIIVLITALNLLIAIAGYFYYKSEESSIRQQKYSELKAIADLKVSQIENWIQERRADANVITQSPFFVQGIYDWLNTGSAVLKANIIERLQPVQKGFGYENIFLTKPNGQLLLSVKDESQEFEPFVKQKIVEASQKHEIVFTDFYRCSTDNKIHYDIISPIIDDNKNTIAILVFRRNPYLYLYPLIQTWPTPSPSSETTILRVENDSVVFLNELRHRTNTALKLKIPLTRTEVPAVQAALGRTGLFEGIDYRGVEVLSDIRIIPAANWIMLAKVDKSEIFSDLYLSAGVISGFSILLIVICGVGFAFIYKSRQKNIFMELYNKEKELWQHQERFRVTMESLGEGIITTDLNGKIQYLNSRAEELTGWHLREAKGRLLSEIYHVKNEETGQIENNILDKVIKHGIVKELANHTILITKAGKEIPVMDTGAPIFNTDGSVNGIVITFHDEAEKRTQQRLIRESEKRYRLLVDSIPNTAVLVFDSNFRYSVASGEEITKSGFDRNMVQGRTLSEAYPPEIERLFAPLYEKALKGEATTFEQQYKDLYYHQQVLPLFDSERKVFGGMVIAHNITDRKRAEEEIVLNARRTQVLLQLNQMTKATLNEITDYALEHAVQLTKSTIGYFAFLNEDESILTMHSWSKSAMAECAINEKPMIYPVVTTGLWGEAVRQRQPVITNDYAADNPLKKGYPPGHVAVKRHMNIPVFEGSRIVLVAGVGNKTDEYNQNDVKQLTLLMEGMWRLMKRNLAEKIQTSVYRISEVTQSANDLIELYSQIHKTICDLMPAKNFYIALYDSASDLLHFPYYADEYDTDWAPLKPGRSLTAYVLRTGNPLLATQQIFEQLQQAGEVDLIGVPSAYWLGVPLKTQQGATFGVMAVQTYKEDEQLESSDMEILMLMSFQVAMAIERKRAERDLNARSELLRGISKNLLSYLKKKVFCLY